MVMALLLVGWWEGVGGKLEYKNLLRKANLGRPCIALARLWPSGRAELQGALASRGGARETPNAQSGYAEYSEILANEPCCSHCEEPRRH